MYHKAADIIRKANRVTGFTGAGISVESGIPPFRGSGGLWEKYDPYFIEIQFFIENPAESWRLIREVFYDFMGNAKPNLAHKGLAILEKEGMLNTIITQNIDNLHQEAGSQEVYEFHGNTKYLVCLECGASYPVSSIDMNSLPPLCKICGGLLKPDFIFFGEGIPEKPYTKALFEAEHSDVFIVIGTTGEIMPAAMIPGLAKRNGAKIIEINPRPSNYTHQITDVFLKADGTEAMQKLLEALGLEISD